MFILSECLFCTSVINLLLCSSVINLFEVGTLWWASLFCIVLMNSRHIGYLYVLWLLPHHCMLIVLYLGWVLLLARGICLVPEVKCRCKPLPILLFGNYSCSNLVSITDGVSTWSPSVIHTRCWQYLFQYYRCLLSFFMSLCREIIVYISLTASWI